MLAAFIHIILLIVMSALFGFLGFAFYSFLIVAHLMMSAGDRRGKIGDKQHQEMINELKELKEKVAQQEEKSGTSD